jgi:hypothetical protein
MIRDDHVEDRQLRMIQWVQGGKVNETKSIPAVSVRIGVEQAVVGIKISGSTVFNGNGKALELCHGFH